MQYKPLLITILILGGLALVADLLVLQKQNFIAPVKQSVMPVPLARITPVPIDSVDQVILRSVPLPEPEIDEHTVARAIQDLIVVARIEKRLFEENLLQRVAVQVTASEGEVVLTGRATSEMQKRKVEELVQRVPGVQRLENRIDVP
jgi:hypothetical protein